MDIASNPHTVEEILKDYNLLSLMMWMNFTIFVTQKSFQVLLRKQEGDRAMWEYPFVVAGVNITFMLIQMLDLEAVKPRTLVGATFLKFLAENDYTFDLLYGITFKLIDPAAHILANWDCSDEIQP